MRWCLVTLLTVLCGVASAEPQIDQARAKLHYQLFCQGCHVGDGSGGGGVPPLNNLVGYFLKTPTGREYLVRVPGVANAALNDEMLAELMNWTIISFGADSVPANWQHYDAAEVGRLRQTPLYEVVRRRTEVLHEALRAR